MTDNDGLGGQTAASEEQFLRSTRNVQPKSYVLRPDTQDNRMFPPWSIPILAFLLGLTLAVARYAKPEVQVWYYEQPTTTTTVPTPSGDQTEVTP